jgi:HSP20 family protein
MGLLRREFAPLFRRFFGSWPVPDEPEMEDTGQEVVVRMAVPGFEAKDLDIRVNGKLLTVHTAAEKEGEEGAGRYRGDLHETILLPEGTDPEHVEALYRNGVLEVRVPKLPEARARRIEVKT